MALLPPIFMISRFQSILHCMIMALLKVNNSDQRQVDEFFGDEDDGVNNGVGNTLAEADDSAQRERQKTHGFHETFAASEEAALQEGFEKGYRETFDLAHQIGRNLGIITLHEKFSEEKQTLTAASEVRRCLADSNISPGDLGRLDRTVKELLDKTNASK